MLIARFIWSIGTAIIWYKGHLRLPPIDQPEVCNGWRAVIGLARAMEVEFQATQIDLTATTDAKGKSDVRTNLCGGSVSFRD